MRFGPIQRGIVSAAAFIFALAVALTVGFGSITGLPSSGLLRALAEAGIGLLIAYSVVIAGAEVALSRRGSRERHESWLGFTSGVAFCGLAGIAVAFALSALGEAGHGGFLMELGVWWAVGSIGMLGIVVAAQPIFAYEWRGGS